MIDWRAQMSLPFYQARPGEPMGVRSRRRFGFSHGQLTAYEDEDLTTVGGVSGLESEILESEIERPRTGPMRDIVATIQPEQDRIVRARLSDSLCIQGAPGTGKTAVGLHRAAYLLYAYREQLARPGCWWSARTTASSPTSAMCCPPWARSTPPRRRCPARHRRHRRRDPRARSGARGVDQGRRTDGRDAAPRRLGHVGRPTEALVVPRGAYQWRVGSYLADEIVDELTQRGVRYEAGRTMLPQRLAHQVLVRMETAGDSPDDRVQNSVARSKPVKTYADGLWPKVDPVKLVLRLLTDAEFLATAAAGILTPEEQELIMMVKPARTAGSARWSLADVVLIDETADLIDRTPSLGTRDPRRGAGPLADAAARGRTPSQRPGRSRCSAIWRRPPPPGRPLRGRSR